MVNVINRGFQWSSLSLLVSVLFLSQGLMAQEKSDVEPASCRCCSLDRFYASWMKELPRPKLRKYLGNASLKITTKSEKAQQYFNQGLNCIHGFWEFEAYRYFLAVIEEDPECAMGYWGISMSLPGKNSEAKAERKLAVEMAKKLSVKASEHEQFYIQSLDVLISLGTDDSIDVLKKIVSKYPEDMNAVGLCAYWLRKGYDAEGKPFDRTAEAIRMIESALKKHPDNTGLIHYYIHIIEAGPDFKKAQPYLDELIKHGKEVSHLVHMPAHIYFLGGDYEKAAKACADCYKLETEYFKLEKISPIDQPNYAHNLLYWSKVLAEKGDYEEAVRVAKLLADSYNSSDRENGAKRQLNYDAITAESFIEMRFNEFEKAKAALNLEKVDKESALYYHLQFLGHYCLLMLEMQKEKGEWNVVYTELEEMEKVYKQFKAAQNKEPSNQAVNQNAERRMKIFLSASRVWQMNVESGKKLDLSWVEFLLADEKKLPYDEPPILPCVMAEEVGDLCLLRKNGKLAIKYFEMALIQRPNSKPILQGLLSSYKLVGREKKIAELELLLQP